MQLEPRMIHSGCVLYRQYLITVHAMERYIERFGGDVGNMIYALQNAWSFNFRQRGLPIPACRSAVKCEREGGWALSDGEALFLIKPSDEHSVIITVLEMYKKQEKQNAKIADAKIV